MKIESIILQRMTLQSTRNILSNEFGINYYGLDAIKQSAQKNYPQWDDKKKKKFILTLGGRVNFKETEQYLAK